MITEFQRRERKKYENNNLKEMKFKSESKRLSVKGILKIINNK